MSNPTVDTHSHTHTNESLWRMQRGRLSAVAFYILVDSRDGECVWRERKREKEERERERKK